MKEDNTIPESFKMTELGLLPETWEVVRLGICCRVFSGYAFKSSDFSNEGTPIIKIGNLQDGTIIVDKRTNFYPEEITQNLKKFILKADDVLIALTGATTGKVAVVPKDFESALLNQRVGKFDVYHKNLNKLFARFYFITKNFQEGIRGKILQSAQGNVSPKQIDNLKVPLPPLPEQKRIAAVLSAVQKAKEKTRAVIKAAKELKKSLMKYLFTYGPVPTEEAEDIPLEETEIGLIPGDWRIVKLGSIADFKNGINFTRNQKGKLGILTIDVLNMYGEGIYVSLNNLYRVNKEVNEDYLLRNGDILFVRSSLKREGVGWTSLFKETQESVAFCGFIIRARLKSNVISPEFLANYLRTSNARENLIASSGKVAITNINQGMLGRILIPLPSLLVQQKIVETLSAVDKKIEAEENKRKMLEELFKTLLKNLMTAKVRVNRLEIVV